ETSRFVPNGSMVWVPSTSTTVGPSRSTASASADGSRTTSTLPPCPPTAPEGASSVGTPAKPVGVGDHTGPSAVLRPTGTCILRSSSSPPVRGGGAAGAAAVVAGAAADATPRAVVNWRRDTKGMIILDLFSAVWICRVDGSVGRDGAFAGCQPFTEPISAPLTK